MLRSVPIAFSSKPLETLLLGRAKIFDSLNIYFHSKARRTVFFTPNTDLRAGRSTLHSDF